MRLPLQQQSITYNIARYLNGLTLGFVSAKYID
jgi:hypothetical protein